MTKDDQVIGKVTTKSAELLLIRGALAGVGGGCVCLLTLLATAFFGGSLTPYNQYGLMLLSVSLLPFMVIVGVIVAALIWTAHEMSGRDFGLTERSVIAVCIMLTLIAIFHYVGAKSPSTQAMPWKNYLFILSLFVPAGVVTGAAIGNQTYVKPTFESQSE